MSTADVLAINAPGYLPMPADDDNALFQGVAQCYLRGSFNLSTGRGVDAYEDLPLHHQRRRMLNRLLGRGVVI